MVKEPNLHKYENTQKKNKIYIDGLQTEIEKKQCVTRVSVVNGYSSKLRTQNSEIKISEL